MAYFNLREDAELLELARATNPDGLAFTLADRLEQALTLEEQLEAASQLAGDRFDSIIELNEEIDGLKHEITLLKEELAEANELLAQQREKELVNT
jgi:hypothetical protein